MTDCRMRQAGLCEPRQINQFTDREMGVMKAAEVRGHNEGRKAALLEAAASLRVAASFEGKTTARIFEKAAKLCERWAANGRPHV